MSKMAANKKHRGKTMLEFPSQQDGDRHFAPENCILGCAKSDLESLDVNLAGPCVAHCGSVEICTRFAGVAS
jgi:hypothetical protein